MANLKADRIRGHDGGLHRQRSEPRSAEQAFGHGTPHLPGKRIDWIALGHGMQRHQGPATPILFGDEGREKRARQPLAAPLRGNAQGEEPVRTADRGGRPGLREPAG